MKNNLVQIFVSLLVITSCEIDVDAPFENDEQKIYTIKEGKHESNRIPKFLVSEGLSFQAKFDETAIYETRIKENQSDINKLMGFSDCNTMHQENSARFGWRWYNNRLEIHAYCYVKGDRIIEYITSVSIGEMNDYKIENKNNRYILTVNNDRSIEVNKKEKCSGDTNYMLFPYFGGDEPAPHDIHVEVHIDEGA